MYEIDDQDRVVPLNDIPRPCAGAPDPVIVATESQLLVCYYTYNEPKDRVCVFEAKAHGVIFGEPSNETLSSHPLYERGLSFYGAFEVLNSSWHRKLAERNAMCFPDAGSSGSENHHLIICFHDSTIEFSASSWQARTEEGPIHEAFSRALRTFPSI